MVPCFVAWPPSQWVSNAPLSTRHDHHENKLMVWMLRLVVVMQPSAVTCWAMGQNQLLMEAAPITRWITMFWERHLWAEWWVLMIMFGCQVEVLQVYQKEFAVKLAAAVIMGQTTKHTKIIKVPSLKQVCIARLAHARLAAQLLASILQLSVLRPKKALLTHLRLKV